MVDRAAQLKGDVQRSNSLVAAEQGELSTEFLKRIEGIKNLLGKLKSLVDKVEEAHGKSLQAVSEDESKKTRDLVEQLMVDISGINFQLRKELKEIDQENKEIEKSGKNQGNDFKIRVTQHALVTKQFQEQVTKYNDTQTKFKDKYKSKIEKQYKIIKPNATKEEIEDVITSPNPDAVFTQQVLFIFI